MKYSLAGICALTLALTGMTASADAETDTGISPHSAVDIRLGANPFLGIASVEYQKGHYGMGIGFPGHLAVSYYLTPGQDSFFYSGGLSSYEIDGFNDYVEGYYFQRKETRKVALGGGYRWLWQSGWNVTASASVSYVENTYYEYSFRAEETLYSLGLGLAVGYAF